MQTTKTTSVLLTLLISIGLTGCQITPNQLVNDQVKSVQKSNQVQAKKTIDIPQDQDRFKLAQSPWGEQVEVQVLERYTAASGRECARLDIMQTQTSSQTTAALVCQYPNGSWIPSRHF
ncbi:hypothetical protein JX580_05040 [Thiomicrospira microaerophila]|uniref:DVU3141 family protein n=1 Tax=Thiomicrospira microaerophila TaxID=406020 RepID=UPI00200FA429|nr:DVU3141 family protein [Thiomicrospira microaerophila]UQB43242.1 hypothetical protein JX580_05040 [Thiomicrospira microaerophila]